jgi:DNA-binding IclR family transcriptional regulator
LAPERRRELLAGPLARYTARTKTDRDEVLAEIAASAAQGYFLDRDEFTEGLGAVALALDEPSLTDFSIAIVAPAQRFFENLDSYLARLFEVRTSLASSRRFPPNRR